MTDYNRYISLLDLSRLTDFVRQHGRLKHYKKGEYFSPLNQQPKLIGYIIKGAFRYSCIHTNGSNPIIGYAFDEGFVGDYPSFRNRMPSNVYIQAICDSEVYVVSYEQLNEFYKSSPENQLLGQKVAEVLLLEVYDRMISLYNQTPEERYLDIVESIPDLLTKISLKELASYLMITPETLSRIRKRLVKG